MIGVTGFHLVEVMWLMCGLALVCLSTPLAGAGGLVPFARTVVAWSRVARAAAADEAEEGTAARRGATALTRGLRTQPQLTRLFPPPGTAGAHLGRFCQDNTFTLTR